MVRGLGTLPDGKARGTGGGEAAVPASGRCTSPESFFADDSYLARVSFLRLTVATGAAQRAVTRLPWVPYLTYTEITSEVNQLQLFSCPCRIVYDTYGECSGGEPGGVSALVAVVPGTGEPQKVRQERWNVQ